MAFSQREISLLYLIYLKTRKRAKHRQRSLKLLDLADARRVKRWVVGPHVLDWNIIKLSCSARAVPSDSPTSSQKSPLYSEENHIT